MLIALLDRNVVTFSDVKVGTYYFVFFCLGPISILKSALHSKKFQPNFPNMTKLKTIYFDGPKAGDWNKNIHSKIKSYFLAFVFLSEHTYSPRCYVTFDPLFFQLPTQVSWFKSLTGPAFQHSSCTRQMDFCVKNYALKCRLLSKQLIIVSKCS